MRLIFEFIANYLACLWQDARFQISASESAASNGGDGYLVLESADLRLRFVCDRRQVLLDLQPTDDSTSKWYSLDLIRRLFTSKRETSAVLDEAYAAFLCENLTEIEDRFSNAKWVTTEAELKKLIKKRDKERFG